MNHAAHSARRAAELPFDDSEVGRGGHGPGAAFGPAATGAAVRTGADAAGGETSAGANVALGDGDGFGATCAAPSTDDHNRPYHGCDTSACAAADADATGVGDSVTYGTCPGKT
jgi:hypothetical protein